VLRDRSKVYVSSPVAHPLALFEVAEALAEELSASRYRANSQLRSLTT
jgi:hypothetical protein